MTNYHADLLATPVPRYTSYPSAAEFHAGVGHDDMAGALAKVGDDAPVSIYLHIPFCKQLCWYCGCNTGATGRGDRLAAYLERLTDEIALTARHLDGRGRIGRIAFGGGSPNAVATADFAALLGAVRRSFAADDAVVSVEIDPRHLNPDWAAMLGDLGVTRASLGVQTLEPQIQAAIGRIQPQWTIERAVRLLRDAGIASLNFDLMYGLPGQTCEDLAATLAQAVAMAPDRLAVFGYAHVPHLIARQRRIAADALPGPVERFAHAAMAHDQLVAAGYDAVGFDHFARPADPLAVAARAGRLRRNFQGFTDDQADVTLGLGVSAISVFPDRLLQNDKHSGRYHLAVGGGRFAAAAGCSRSSDDRARGAVIATLLGQGCADAGRLANDLQVRARLQPFEQRGLISWHGTRLVLADDAIAYARSVAAAFDTYRDGSSMQLSRAV